MIVSRIGHSFHQLKELGRLPVGVWRCGFLSVDLILQDGFRFGRECITGEVRYGKVEQMIEVGIQHGICLQGRPIDQVN